MIQFRNRDIELEPQLVLQAAQHLALILQRLRIGNVQFQSEQSYGHGFPGTAASLFFSGGDARLSRSFRRGKLLHVEAFQDVADLYVVEVGDAGAALKAGAHFARVIFEALERIKLRRVNDGSITHNSYLRVTLEDAVHDVTTGDCAGTFDPERVANFPATEIVLLKDRLEQAFHGFFELVGNFINDVVHADVDFFLLRKFSRLALRPHAERDDDRAGGARKKNVIFADGSDAGADNFQLHLIGRKLWQHFAQHFDAALDVRLDDDRQFLDFAGFELLVQLVERDARPGRPRKKRRVALFRLAVVHNVARFGFVRYREVIARFRNAL